MTLTYHLGQYDQHQGLYFLGNYVKDNGRWRRPTFTERLRHAYPPEFIETEILGKRGQSLARLIRRA